MSVCKNFVQISFFLQAECRTSEATDVRQNMSVVSAGQINSETRCRLTRDEMIIAGPRAWGESPYLLDDDTTVQQAED